MVSKAQLCRYCARSRPSLAHYVIKARKQTANVTIVFLTAYLDDDQQIIDGYERGAVDYVAKPLHPSVLLTAPVFPVIGVDRRPCECVF